MNVYYNELDSFCCSILRARCAEGGLYPGHVDERDIRNVTPDDVRGFDQCHFFAGIGGLVLGLRWAGMPIDFPIWTGGFPCTNISASGDGSGLAGDESGLWMEFFRLVAASRPRWLLIENSPLLRVRGADDVLDALDSVGYAAWPLVVGSEDVGAPQGRSRAWVVAHTDSGGPPKPRQPKNVAETARVWEADQPFAPVPVTRPPRPELVASIPLATDGISAGLARQRKHQLMAIGNSADPAVVELVGRAILMAESQSRSAP